MMSSTYSLKKLDRFIILFLGLLFLTIMCGSKISIPNLGDESPVELMKPNSQRDLIMGDGTVYNSYEIGIADMSFLIAHDADNIITYILALDSSFKTPEGLIVGMQIEKALELSDYNIQKKQWKGFTEYYVLLPSGWCAIIQGKDEPTPDEPIQFLLKDIQLNNK